MNLPKISRALLIGALVFLCLGITAKLFFSWLLPPSYLEELLEKNLSASAQIESTHLNLLKKTVTLRGLELQASEVNFSTPDLAIEEAQLGVKILPLLFRKLETTSFIIRKPTIRMKINEDGDLSLEDLFRNPRKKKKQPNPPAEPQITLIAQEPSEPKQSALDAKNSVWLTQLEEARLEEGEIQIVFEKENLNLSVQGLNLTFRDLEFDPEDLETLNHADMSLAGVIRVTDSEQVKLIHLDLDGEAIGRVFDEKTGELNLDLKVDFAIGENSLLNPQIEIVRRVWSVLEEVERVGIPLGKLPDAIRFGRSRRIKGRYSEGIVSLDEPLSLTVAKWHIGVAGNSWLETHSGQHSIGAELIAGEKTSQVLDGWISTLPQGVRNLAKGSLFEKSQVLWRVNSSGDIQNPELEYLSQLPGAESLIEGVEDALDGDLDDITDRAKGLLRGLLGN